ncbi:hypothetical protein RFI_02750, partial [Reticulomyxa filosa]
VLNEMNKIKQDHAEGKEHEMFKRMRKEDNDEWFPIHEQENVIIQEEERMENIRKYYEKLYSEGDEAEDESHLEKKNKYKGIMKEIQETERKGNDQAVELIEIEQAAKQLGNHKATFLDCISNEIVKAIVKEDAEILRKFINKLLENPLDIPKKLLASKLVIIPKKGCPTGPEDTRGIRVKSAILTLIDKLLLNRIKPTIEKSLSDEQGGFRPGRGTINQLIAFRLMIYHAKYVSQKEVYVLSVDFRKAFDS